MAEPSRSVTPEGVRTLLEQRARALARPLEPEAADDVAELVVLLLGAERYGVDIRNVHDTLRLPSIAPIPGTPRFWAGVVNVRGMLYPVLDLARYLGLTQENGNDGPKKLVRVSAKGATVGLMVDDAPAVHRIRAGDLGPPLLGGAAAARGVVRGMTPDLLAVLDVDALLSDSRLTMWEDSN
jgi:chemotaxis signal transduction protein